MPIPDNSLTAHGLLLQMPVLITRGNTDDRTTWGEFLDANPEPGSDEMALVACYLFNGDSYKGGGGAEGEWSIKVDIERGKTPEQMTGAERARAADLYRWWSAASKAAADVLERYGREKGFDRSPPPAA